MKQFLLLFSLLISFNLWAQGQVANGPEMADLMYQNGRIYVVVATLLILMIGFFLYLWKAERKIGELERKYLD